MTPHFGLKMVLLAGGLTSFNMPQLAAQCTLYATPDESLTRSGANETTGTVTAYPTTIIGNWSVTLTSTILFTPTGGSESAIATSTTGPFNWTPSTTLGSASTQTASAVEALEPHGTGSYRTRVDSSGVCGGTTYPVSPEYSSATSIARPTISPSAGTYGTTTSGEPRWAMWYMNGLSSPDGFLTTANLTTTTNLGGCGGCSPTYLWENTDNSGAVSFSPTNSTSTTITSQRASGGASYDTSVRFSMDGFYAESKLWLNLNTPSSFLNNGSSTAANADCPSTGYDTQVSYSILDLWNYETSPVTTHEVNDSGYSNDYGIGLVGWYLCCFANDYTWSTGEFLSSYLYETHFVDHLYFCNGSGYVPAATYPQGLSVAVFSVPQTFYVGASYSAGSTAGVNTHSDTQHFFTDHGSL